MAEDCDRSLSPPLRESRTPLAAVVPARNGLEDKTAKSGRKSQPAQYFSIMNANVQLCRHEQELIMLSKGTNEIN